MAYQYRSRKEPPRHQGKRAFSAASPPAILLEGEFNLKVPRTISLKQKIGEYVPIYKASKHPKLANNLFRTYCLVSEFIRHTVTKFEDFEHEVLMALWKNGIKGNFTFFLRVWKRLNGQQQATMNVYDSDSYRRIMEYLPILESVTLIDENSRLILDKEPCAATPPPQSSNTISFYGDVAEVYLEENTSFKFICCVFHQQKWDEEQLIRRGLKLGLRGKYNIQKSHDGRNDLWVVRPGAVPRDSPTRIPITF